MTRKDAIQAQARYHKAKGIYDNSICKTGIERNIYATTWEITK